MTYDKIYSNFHTFWKDANFQLRFWGKKFRGLNICAKTLFFGILTLDRLFLKRYVAIFLILIFLSDMACESCLNWQKMAKIVIFQLWRSKNRVTNQLIKNSRITFLKNHMEMLHAKFRTISMNIIASKFFFVEFFWAFFCPIWPPKFNILPLKSWKITILAEKLIGNQKYTT